ncbi:VOC family protein [Leptolyngbya sp. 7M]|uniref:VOC family protein n=1 Tax=Leptolyngbya sp. 7M TaxID=2812896 RepID=UPI0021F12537|nr:VOC family protein [Leptolyngbya sp. 7M]
MAEQLITAQSALRPGMLRRVHHIALHVRDMNASCHFYGQILGLRELQGEEVPETLKALFEAGEAANFVTPDGTVIDLFWKPQLEPPDPDPGKEFTRAGHLAFDIDPALFDQAVDVLRQNQIPIDHGPVSRPTGRGIYLCGLVKFSTTKSAGNPCAKYPQILSCKTTPTLLVTIFRITFGSGRTPSPN